MKTNTINQAIDILKHLRQITEGGGSITEKLDNIVKIIVAEMDADAGACYIMVDENTLELFASHGFNKDITHKITLRISEGLVGEVARNTKSLAISDAWSHPSFIHKPEMGEENYKSFLGVPLIRNSRTVGVFTLQHKKNYEFSRNEIEILETVAMIMSDIVVSEEFNDYKKTLIKGRGLSERERVKGVSLSKGYGIGQAVVHRRRQAVTKIFSEDKEKELRRLEIAHRQMNADLDEKFAQTKLGIGEHADILDAYKMFAKDKGWYQKIYNNVESGLTAEAAVERSYEDMWNRLSGTTDNYLKERLSDLRDVADRLQSYLSGDYSGVDESEDYNNIVVIAQTMGPADLMDYDYKKIKGLLIEEGTSTMHVTIVAKALNIPVISKTRGLFDEIKTGQLIAVDGDEGYVYINPDKSVQEKFQKKISDKTKLLARLAEMKKLPSKTLDNVRINHYINVGLAFDLEYIDNTNCDGVGLYRTEIPFMTTDTMPNVEKQTEYYKELMDKSGHKKVIFRSLDVGSDKLLPYWSNFNEDNPAIGWRSIRITLDRRAILRKQVRAFLRAAADKELNVMFPMISDLEEFEEAKETLMIELEKEKKKGNPVPKKVNVGLMIEVPALLFQLEAILEAADFISIGTNDLAQFVFAADRGNSKLTDRYDVLSAPFLKIMGDIVKKASSAGVYCSVCGEMASNPIEAMALIGLGYRNLSSSGASFGRVKSMIRSISVDEVSDYIYNLLESSRRSLRPQLISYAHDHGIEIY